MADIDEDDDDMFITQNTFRTESSESLFPDFNILLFDDVQAEIKQSPAAPFIEENEPLGNTEIVCPKRNINLVSDQDLERAKATRIPKGTKSTTDWSVKTWNEWAKERNTATTSNIVIDI